jgi:cation/acetate symporter
MIGSRGSGEGLRAGSGLFRVRVLCVRLRPGCRFNTRGCLWSIYGGLTITVVLIAFSPAVSGNKTAMFPDADWSWFPLANPGLVAIPASFLLGYIGSITSPEHLEYKAAEMEVRSLTGAGAEGKAVEH